MSFKHDLKNWCFHNKSDFWSRTRKKQNFCKIFTAAQGLNSQRNPSCNAPHDLNRLEHFLLKQCRLFILCISVGVRGGGLQPPKLARSPPSWAGIRFIWANFLKKQQEIQATFLPALQLYLKFWAVSLQPPLNLTPYAYGSMYCHSLE